MDTTRVYPPYRSTGQLEHGSGRFEVADPWSDPDIGQAQRDNWMLSYIDILTLLLTLFVLLLVLQPKYDSPNHDGIPELAGLAALTPIERPPVKRPEMPPAGTDQAIFPPADIGNIGPAELTAELGIDASAMSVEPEISIEMLGDAPFLGLQQLKPPQAEAALQIAPTGAEPAPRLPAVSAVNVDSAATRPLREEETSDASKALRSIMTALAEQRLDKRLEVSQIAEGVHLEVRDNILFAEGSAKLKPQGRHLLDKLATVLLQHQGIISVEGHTDDRPISSTRFPSNWELSSGRATTVTRYLIGHGLNATKLRAVGYADTRPLESNTSAKGRARNRRVSLILELGPRR